MLGRYRNNRFVRAVKWPFGGPYKPVVTVSPEHGSHDADDSEEHKVSLDLSVVGSGGEICTGLMVDGKRPKSPKFTISTPDGKEVQKGEFGYG